MTEKGYTLSPQELRAVQMVELELLCEVDRICQTCGISYRIVAGTMLGAVRHGGFIPWDDDADVAFLRDEYERFRIACETELDVTRFYFQDHRNTPGYRWGYGKLRRKGTAFVRLQQEHMPYEQGIFIDIFPYDGMPDNYLLRCWHCFRCFLYRKAFWSEVGRRTATGLPRLVYGVMSRIPPTKLYADFDRFVKHSNRRPGRWIRILTFPTPTRDHGYKRKWAFTTRPILFEGVLLQGVADYDEYLTFKYGDYMTLPAEGQRKTHPISRLELPIDRRLFPMKRIKVLQLPISNQKAGITHYAIRNWNHIDKSRFQFDFVTFSKKLDFEAELTAQGCKVHYVSCYAEENREQFLRELTDILRQGYDALHLHTSYWKNFLVEELALEMGVPIIIVHAHSNMICESDPVLRQALLTTHNRQKELFNHATHFLACAQSAADWLYGPQIPRDKIRILKNAIDTAAFAYNPAVRAAYRRKLNLENAFVIGHVGRFAYQKNHHKLLDIFNRLTQQNARLLLVGDGKLYGEIREEVAHLGLSDRVVFMGSQPDREIPNLMQAMDVFCLPSRFGGLDLVLVEAQTSGLPCLVSDIMPEEARITPHIRFLPEDVGAWCEAITALEDFERRDHAQWMREAGYSLTEQIRELESIYSEGI